MVQMSFDQLKSARRPCEPLAQDIIYFTGRASAGGKEALAFLRAFLIFGSKKISGETADFSDNR